jgi:predicted nucleotidyltransferase
MSNFSSPYTVPESRPVLASILHILAVVHRVAGEQRCPYVVVGATARDLLLFHVFGISAGRATLDVDFAIAVESWDRFHGLRNALLATKEFVPGRVEHRLSIRETEIPIDLLPFGGVAEDETIAWPPAGDTVMTVAGFEDAMAASIQVQVSPALTVPLVSLAALAILKIFAWQDRKTIDKDALDLYRVLSAYADAGNEDRLYDPGSPHLEKFNYDLELAGAALAGEDSRRLSSAATLTRLGTLAAAEGLLDALAERIRASRWQFEPEKLSRVRAVLAAYFDELLLP